MGTPIFKLVYDRRKRASNTKEGAIELRITYNRVQRFITTGVRVLPKQWRNGSIVNRLDAFELQRTLDIFVANARRIVNEQMEAGTLDMQTIVSVVGGKEKQQSTANVPHERDLHEFIHERMAIRTYGLTEDSKKRYERFVKWFEEWGVIKTFEDINEINILKLNDALMEKKLKPYSAWNNYHRFLVSFILDAIKYGIMSRNPYEELHIDKEPTANALDKVLTMEEFKRIEAIEPNTEYMKHTKDLFIFQAYTGLSYCDLMSFDSSKIRMLNGKPVYSGRRGKTKKEYTFLLLKPALQVLEANGGKLPKMSNQKYNEYIKALAMAAGITKSVSCHWARHTCATMLFNNRVDIEIVKKVLGHSTSRVTREVYAKLLDETVADAMAEVEGSLFD